MSVRNTEDKISALLANLHKFRGVLEERNRLELERRFVQEVFQEIGRLEKEKRRRHDKPLLGKLRAHPEYEKSFSEKEPLVTVIIPTYERTELIAQKTLPSILCQDYQNWEVIIVGDHSSPENCEILKRLNSNRIRFYNLKRRGKYPLLPAPRWHVAGIKPINFGLRLSRGRWITHLDDDDEFTPKHISSLLSVALSKRVEWVHGQVLFVNDKDGNEELIGSDPPTLGRISRISSLYHGSLGIFKYNSQCWKYLYPGDWDLWERFLEMGVTHAHLPEIIGIHHGAADVLEKLYVTDDVTIQKKQPVQTILTQIEDQLTQLQAAAQAQRSALAEKDRRVAELTAELQARIRQQEIDLGMVYNSLGWMVTSKFRRVKDRFLTPGTKRRKLYDLILAAVKGRLNNRRVSYEQQPFLSNSMRSKQVAVMGLDEAFEAGHLRSCLYASSLGNYFFLEIRELLASGFRELGFEVNLRDERDGFAEEADWHVVVAPHEFFYLGVGETLRNERTPRNLILLNTEQPSTQWFSRAYDTFTKAHRVWDINYESSQLISKMGFACDYLPLGHVSKFELFKEIKELPEHYGTCFLESKIRKASYLYEALSKRPIDVMFIGNLTKRRDEFFANAASVFSNYLCYFWFSDGASPLISGKNTYMNTATAVGVAQRSKIVLNIHQGQDKYFEWHRIVMHGIWNKAVVISEPSGNAPPFQPGIDFVEAPLEQIPKAIVHYLSTADGQKEAQMIASQGFETLAEKCKLADSLRPLILQLYSSERSSDS